MTHSKCFLSALLALTFLPTLPANDLSNPQYLAIGDSIAFGMNPTVQNPDRLEGYPEKVAAAKQVQHVKKVMNLACPGETSASFISTAVPDNGCRDYKAAFGLHVNYPGSQLDAAVAALRADKRINLVTITLGANDVRVLQFTCNFAPSCVGAGLGGVLLSLGQNLGTILYKIRSDAGYQGRIIVVTYYSLDYADLFVSGAILYLNSTLATVASQFSADVADGFTAFAAASAPHGGNPCAAGLLIPLPGGGCDLHPSSAGAQLLADTVLAILGKNKN